MCEVNNLGYTKYPTKTVGFEMRAAKCHSSYERFRIDQRKLVGELLEAFRKKGELFDGKFGVGNHG